MPSPIAHSLVGLALAEGTRPHGCTGRRRGALLIGAVFLANAPDLDFLPGLLAGTPGAFHRQAAHSVAAALFVAGLASTAALKCVGHFRHVFFVAASTYGSHLVLDYMGEDHTGHTGIWLWWPFSSKAFQSCCPLFRSIEMGGTRDGFLVSVLTWHNVNAVLLELVVLTPLVGAALLFRRYRRRLFESNSKGTSS